MNNNITRENIVANAAKYGIEDIEGLCSRVCGLMAYNETKEEYNFLCNTVYGDTNIDKLPVAYLPKAAKQIRDVMGFDTSVPTRNTRINYMYRDDDNYKSH